MMKQKYLAEVIALMIEELDNFEEYSICNTDKERIFTLKFKPKELK